MNLENIIRLDLIKNIKYLNESKELIDEAFEKEVQFDFEYIVSLLKDDSFKIYLYFYKDKLIGLTHEIIYNNLAYLNYLCVKKEFQNIGIGSYILNDFKKRNSKYSIFLCAESNFNNDFIKEKRLNFYYKNGFKNSSLYYFENKIPFDILYYKNFITKKEIVDLYNFFSKGNIKKIENINLISKN